MPRILAIAGSPSHPSRTFTALEYAQQILEQENLVIDFVSVRDFSAEALLFAQFDHPDIQRLTRLVEQADAVILATPVYKASYTGVLKALLDLLPQNALVGKPVLAIATGGTLAHYLILDYALKPVLSALGARHIPAGVYVLDTQIQKLPNGEYQLDEEVKQRLEKAVQDFITTLTSPKGIPVGANY
ncbi:NADPH-dependent FMN reductase [Geitlerinema splendidum]|nr:NADPH-dependent FMN reductase [Geitlerinema splendidum]